MLDLKFVRSNPEAVRKDLLKRKDAEKLGLLDAVVVSDKRHREVLGELEKLRAKRNQITRQINEAIKGGKSQLEIDALKQEASSLPQRIKQLEAEEKQLEEQIVFSLMRLPNLLHEAVPVGEGSEDNVEIRRRGIPGKFGFELKVHGELAQEKGWADFERAAKISGGGFSFVLGDLALLDLALQQYALEKINAKGFTLVQPPLLLDKKPYEGVTDLKDFETVMYKLEGEEKYLIATSEHSMVAMHQGEIFQPDELPVKYCGVSTCFRREIGSHGVDTRGFFRMHQFNKVEQVVLCKPEESWKIFEELIANAEELWSGLEIPYRVVEICTGDIGVVAARKYDLEAWFPREQKYQEVVSCSNCTGYQATRLNIKYRLKKGGEEKEHVHTLNCTAIATSRAIRAILENYQQPDGSVEIPKVLWKYMGGKTELEPGKKISHEPG